MMPTDRLNHFAYSRASVSSHLPSLPQGSLADVVDCACSRGQVGLPVPRTASCLEDVLFPI